MTADDILLEAEVAMEKSVDYMIHEFASVRTGKRLARIGRERGRRRLRFLDEAETAGPHHHSGAAVAGGAAIRRQRRARHREGAQGIEARHYALGRWQIDSPADPGAFGGTAQGSG